MFFRKTMSLLGIGSTKIDLVLEKRNYFPGDKVTGYFLFKGGNLDQYIKRIDCDLIKEDTEKDQETVIETTTILSSRVIQANKDDKLSFTFSIPEDVEPSSKNVMYYFKSKLFFHEGVESKDRDIIYIKSKVDN
ncbi:sporulation-control protein [Salirhabdus euzebyi]|uniref:Sporulation-control protein n=1 Tax=Salirhabdus euzebyi TaxID=394506 RepID=A0A841PXA0_9BACI|nr:sporulation protein [Salirhabdus euzebyi]MBB6452624.1 sporulation-control protein [Salirhabdus euzebyi]